MYGRAGQQVEQVGTVPPSRQQEHSRHDEGRQRRFPRRFLRLHGSWYCLDELGVRGAFPMWHKRDCNAGPRAGTLRNQPSAEQSHFMQVLACCAMVAQPWQCTPTFSAHNLTHASTSTTTYISIALARTAICAEARLGFSSGAVPRNPNPDSSSRTVRCSS